MSTDKSVHATVRMVVAFEYDTGSWGQECTTSQVYEQATREALEGARGLIFSTHRLPVSGRLRVGQPAVERITLRIGATKPKDDDALTPMRRTWVQRLRAAVAAFRGEPGA